MPDTDNKIIQMLKWLTQQPAKFHMCLLTDDKFYFYTKSEKLEADYYCYYFDGMQKAMKTFHF